MTIQAKLQAAFQLHSAGNIAGALRGYQQILVEQPDQVEALRLLGLIYASQGNLARATKLIRQAVEINPGFAAGQASLGLVLAETGQLDDAVAACRAALHQDSNSVDAHCGLGIALRKKGEVDEAIAALGKALAVNPNSVVAYSNLAPLHGLRGNLPESVRCYRMVCQLSPGQPRPLVQLAAALRPVQFSQFDAGVKSDLLKCFAVEGLRYLDIATATVSVLKLDPAMRPLVQQFDAYGSSLTPAFLSDDVIAALNDALLQALLEKSTVPDADFERLLTRVRALLLELAVAATEDAFEDLGQLASLVYALAQQCFFNEYVYVESEAEIAALATLEARLGALTLPPDNRAKLLLAVYGCYRKLYPLAIAPDLAALEFDNADARFDQLIEDLVANPLAELAMRSEIPSLVVNQDEITKSVQAQYEENPFPRWRSFSDRQPGKFASEINHVLPHVAVADNLDCESPEILIAGCGTGLQAINCSRTYQGARITAIDISGASLAYAKRMTDKLGISNIRYLQANILELDRLEGKFDLIESFGVLHHLSDPFRGWEILSGLLKENAFMMLGLYSDIARRGVVLSRDIIARKSYDSTLDGIRACRQDLFATDEPEIRENIISPGATFWTTSEVRDLIFHAQEYRYTIPELAQTINTLGLEFLGFQHQLAVDSLRYRTLFPDDPNGLSLQNWHRYEQQYPRTFSNTYQFWLGK